MEDSIPEFGSINLLDDTEIKFYYVHKSENYFNIWYKLFDATEILDPSRLSDSVNSTEEIISSLVSLSNLGIDEKD